MKIHKFLLPIVGLVSGYISFLPYQFKIFENFEKVLYFRISTIFPGLVFGIFLSLYFFCTNIFSESLNTFRRLLKAFFLVLFSTLAYFIAYNVTIYVGLSFDSEILGFMIGGTIGSIILISSILSSLSGSKVLRNFTRKEFFTLVLVGALLSLSWSLGSRFGGGETHAEPGQLGAYFALFTVWQAGMALALALVFDRGQKR